MATKLGTCTVTEGYALDITAFRTPFDEDFLEALKEQFSGQRRWNADEKIWEVADEDAGKFQLVAGEFFNLEYED